MFSYYRMCSLTIECVPRGKWHLSSRNCAMREHWGADTPRARCRRAVFLRVVCVCVCVYERERECVYRHSLSPSLSLLLSPLPRTLTQFHLKAAPLCGPAAHEQLRVRMHVRMPAGGKGVCACLLSRYRCAGIEHHAFVAVAREHILW